MAEYKIHKRTFEAKKFPKGSEKRKELNNNIITSEYGSDRFVLIEENGWYQTYKTLGLAQFALSEKIKYGI